MKTANILIGAALLCLVHTTIYAESLDVPADLKAAANQYQFLSYMARSCDFDLSVYGFEAISKSACADFLNQGPAVTNNFSDGAERWIIIEQAVQSSTNHAAQSEWSLLASQISRHHDQIDKTIQHIQFLINAKKATIAKESTNGSTKTPQKRRASESR